MPRLVAFLLFFLAITAWAGDVIPAASTPGPRKEFRRSKTYPYIFEPVPYLENGVPPTLRFGESSADCSTHNPPPLPKAAQAPPTKSSTSPKPEAPASKGDSHQAQPAPTPAATPAIPDPRPPEPAFPPPQNAQPVTPADALDMTKYPSEVIDVFKNPYNAPKSRKRLFDPVFEPAQAPQNGQAPKAPSSKAVYQQE